MRERLRGAGPVADAVARALFVPPAIQERVAVGDPLAPGVGVDRPERRFVVSTRVVVIVGAVVRRVAEVARRVVGRTNRAGGPEQGLVMVQGRAGGDGSGHAAANISAVQMLIQATPEPTLDKRIAIPERSSDVAINDRHGDSFVVHFANGSTSEAVLSFMRFKDGKIVSMETGATPLSDDYKLVGQD